MMLLVFNLVLPVTFPLWLLLSLAGVVLASVLIVLYRVFIKQYLFSLSNKKETWLPVVDDMCNIVGRVAQSVSFEMPGKFQHPVIRLIVWGKDKIYMKPRDPDLIVDTGKIDHPFVIKLKFGMSIEDTLENVGAKYFSDCPKPVFLLKYRYENSIGKWQILLYYIDVSGTDNINATLTGGKFWPRQQIADNIGKGYFSEIFENEFGLFSALFDKK